MQARAYTPADADRWDAFCAEAYGATFLHTRRFLSYHGDRFSDRSLIFEDGAHWLGVLPAARSLAQPDAVVSHPGITYGGLLHGGALRGEAMLDALQAACRLYAAAGARALLYKPVPHIYQRAPAQDDLYALFRLDARRVRCELSSCITLAHPLPVSERRIASGTSSGGKPVGATSGRRPASRRSMAPEPRNMPIATRIPTRNGMMRTATSNPSFAPSMNTSYTLTPRSIPTSGIATSRNGIAQSETASSAARITIAPPRAQ